MKAAAPDPGERGRKGGQAEKGETRQQQQLSQDSIVAETPPSQEEDQDEIDSEKLSTEGKETTEEVAQGSTSARYSPDQRRQDLSKLRRTH
ncbi:hypothetical protein PR003_g1722 [Phytophthora rubi]|uniref:Uncharacterized protein n=1 Tax=Phytophthora rubi TaxID=129364 RepID=A0A6A3MTE9_9STRA|nr:hypothetical protein PR002_g9362 [Phytophthora rubi]KAE9357536.1 hypothetical protein PR003_g1722 [Phytophthora rubi]